MKKLLLMASMVISAVVITGCGTKDAEPTPNTEPTLGESTSATFAPEITKEQAQEIALEQAGITAEDVIFERIELERDDGVWKYEVEFRKDRTEYDIEINAADGSVISADVDMDD